jgi:two-component system response regulator YesN
LKTIDPEFRIFLEAKDGQEALHIIETTPIDAVFTDIEMPQMNGIELLNILKETSQDIDVVLVSSYDDFEYARQGIVHGAFDYILKPFDTNKIREVLIRLKTAIENRKKKENSKNLLLENLDSLYMCEISTSLVELIQNDAQEAIAYGAKVIETLYETFKHEPIKLEYTIKMFISNTLCEAGKMYPWINSFLHLDNEEYASQEYNYNREYVMSQIKSEVNNISDMITKLYLNHWDPMIKQICQYVIQNTDTKISLDEVAKVFTGF